MCKKLMFLGMDTFEGTIIKKLRGMHLLTPSLLIGRRKRWFGLHELGQTVPPRGREYR